jgi:DNA-binding CsgD family transcriptional regulator/tetratricopeptide (TPR) repeat protein
VEWIGGEQKAWIDRLVREVPNLRVALQFGLGRDQVTDADLELVCALRVLWYSRGRVYMTEAGYFLEAFLRRHSPLSKTLVEALTDAATVAAVNGDLETAGSRVQQAHAAATQLGDPRLSAVAALGEALLHMVGQQLDAANACWQKALDLLDIDSGREFLGWRLTGLTGMAMLKGVVGDVDAAMACQEELLAVCRPIGESWHTGFALWALGVALCRRGEYDAAADRLKDGIRELQRIDDRLGMLWCLETLAQVAVEQGQAEVGANLMGAFENELLRMHAENAVMPGFADIRKDYARRMQDALGETRYQSAFNHGSQLTLDDAVAQALGRRTPRRPARRQDPFGQLSSREREVAHLVAQGLSNKEIADRLVISTRTAEGHVQRMLVKLGLTNRAQLAAWVVAHHSDGEP